MAYYLLRHRDIPDIKNIAIYMKNGGFDGLKKAVTTMQPTIEALEEGEGIR